MELHFLPTNKLKPDPKQPRKTFDTSRLEDMARSMRKGGVVTPIEVDSKHIIICGEQRWRAATIAGLTEVPCVVNDKKFSPMERLMRQCIENAHHSDMSVMDTARAWNTLLSARAATADKPHARPDINKGYSWLAERLGKNRRTVQSIIEMINEPEAVQKVLNNPASPISYTFIAEANLIKNETARKEIKQRLIDGEITRRDDLRQIVRTLNGNPKKAQELGTLPSVPVEKTVAQVHLQYNSTLLQVERLVKEIIGSLANSDSKYKQSVVAGLISIRDIINLAITPQIE